MLQRTALTTVAYLALSQGVGGQPSAPSSASNAKAAYEAEMVRLRERPKDFADTRRTFTLMAQLLLGRLGYGIGPYDGVLDDKTVAALKAYEKARSLPITGDPLAFETSDAVIQDGASLDKRIPFLPERHVDVSFWTSGYVVVVGTWTIAGESQAFPQQTSRMECVQATRTCTEATAILSGTGGLSADVDVYEIERWDDHEIVTKPLEVGFGCVRYTKRVSRLQQSASGIRSTISGRSLCKDVDREEKYLTLADGLQIYRELDDAVRLRWRQLMRLSPDVLSSLSGDKD
jgi:hypothetical protein